MLMVAFWSLGCALRVGVCLGVVLCYVLRMVVVGFSVCWVLFAFFYPYLAFRWMGSLCHFLALCLVVAFLDVPLVEL